MLRAARALLPTFFAIALFLVAVFVLRRELQGHSVGDILAATGSIPPARILLALAMSCLTYAVLTTYDLLALRVLGHRLRFRRIALASFISYAFGNNLGLSAITSGSVRFRFYRESGLSAKEIVGMTVCCGLTFWLGFTAVAGVVFLIIPPPLADLGLPFYPTRPLGALLLILLLLYGMWTVHSDGKLRLFNWTIPAPRPSITVLQILASSTEVLLIAGTIFLLLPSASTIGFAHFLAIFLIAHIAGVVSQVPGGIGVFETVLFELLPGGLDISTTLGTLLAFRIVYNLLPLILAAGLVLLHELHGHRHRFRGLEVFLRRLL